MGNRALQEPLLYLTFSMVAINALQAKAPAEIWRLGRTNIDELYLSQRTFQDSLGDWKFRREDFHGHSPDHSVCWSLYRAGQQDSERERWAGVVARVDGSVNRAQERMGAGELWVAN